MAKSKVLATTDARAAAPPARRGDGWTNVMTGLGRLGLDHRMGTHYERSPVLSEETLRALYSGGGLASNLVDITVDEMTREGFTVNGDQEDAINAYFEELGIHESVEEQLTWDMAFGGAVGLIGAEDGITQIWRPLNEKNIKTLGTMNVFDRWRVSWTSQDLYTDPMHPNYGTPEKYTISPVSGGSFKVHETRLIVTRGELVPPLTRIERMGWGDSFINRCYEALRDLDTAYTDTGDIIHDFITAIFSMKGLMQLIMEGNEKEALERISIIRQTRSIANLNLIDADGETYEKKASTVTGLADLLDRMIGRLCAKARMPATLLVGTSAKGLNPTGEGENKNWENVVKGRQRRKLVPIYKRLITLALLAKDGPKGVSANWRINFNPLSTPTPKEQADLRDKISTTDQRYVDMQVLDPQEVRGRFAGDNFSTEIQLIAGKKPWEEAPPIEDVDPPETPKA